MKHLLGLSLSCGLALFPALTKAQQAQLDTEALMAISAFAEQFCGKYLTEGSSQSVTVSGEAEAELKGLLNRLADLGVSGAASIDSQEYVGVLREDARGAMQDARDCKLVLWESLSRTVVQPKVKDAPQAPALDEGDATELWNEDTIQFTLQPGEARTLKGDDLYRHVATYPQTSCAGPGVVSYSWLIRDPYPEGGDLAIRTTMMGGKTFEVGAGATGSNSMGVCQEHEFRNTSVNPILVQVRYASALQ